MKHHTDESHTVLETHEVSETQRRTRLGLHGLIAIVFASLLLMTVAPDPAAADVSRTYYGCTQTVGITANSSGGIESHARTTCGSARKVYMWSAIQKWNGSSWVAVRANGGYFGTTRDTGRVLATPGYAYKPSCGTYRAINRTQSAASQTDAWSPLLDVISPSVRFGC